MKGLCKPSRLPVKTKNKDELEIDKFPLTHFRSISIIDWIGSRRKLSFLWRKITSFKTSTILHIQTPIHFSLWPWEVCQRHRRPYMDSPISPNPLGQAQADPGSRAQDGERDPRWLDKDDNLKLLTESSAAWNFTLKMENCLLCRQHRHGDCMQRLYVSKEIAGPWYSTVALHMSAKKWLPFWPTAK